MKASAVALLAVTGLTLAACQTPREQAGLLPAPLVEYVCQDSARLGVRLLGDRASVSVNGAAPIDLPAIGSQGTTYSNGRQTLIIEQGRTSWALGRAAPLPCEEG